MEQMCPSCQEDVISHKCIKCGKPLGDSKYKPDSVNPNFDTERFKALSEGTRIQNDDKEIDFELIDQILNNDGK
jgi:hypothetical protein